MDFFFLDQQRKGGKNFPQAAHPIKKMTKKKAQHLHQQKTNEIAPVEYVAFLFFQNPHRKNKIKKLEVCVCVFVVCHSIFFIKQRERAGERRLCVCLITHWGL